MALWKETAQNEQRAMPNEQRAMPNEQRAMPSEPSEKAEKAEPAPAPVNPVAPRRESLPRDRHESVLGSGVSIEGKMEGNGDVRIAGKFKGDIHIKGNLNVQKGAHLTVKINAEAVTIEGEVEGTVVASGQVTLSESAQVVGDLKAKTLTVSAGSRMRGNVEFGWNDSEAAKVANGRDYETGKTVSAARDQAGVAREL
ncbi:MAG TPA: polymer-forming cytoskeletal protein [Candidatus Binatia bacterium]|nr:polymer-forming cytoskeletal protein [Candidatus Binatia bacterium]